MAYNGSCNENTGATNVSQICISWSNLARFWRAVPGFYFASEADAQDEAKIYEAIQQEKLFPFPELCSVEVEDEDTAFDEQPLGTEYIRIGKKKWKLKAFSNPYKDAQLRKHSGLKGGIYHLDSLGGFRGVKNSEDALYPIPYTSFVVEKPEENVGADSTFKTVMSINLSDTQVNSYLDDAAIVEHTDISWNALSIEGLEPVELTVQSASATEIVVKVTIAGTTIPVGGLSTTPSDDFIVRTVAGVEIVPSLITVDATTGVYTLTVAGLVTNDTIALKAPADMATTLATDGIGYKGDKLVKMTVA